MGAKHVLNKIRKLQKKLVIIVICWFLLGAILPFTQGLEINHIKGFDKGPSYTSVVPMEKVTFVNFDENTYIDDYAYLAAVPTTVFNSGDHLFSNPLLFYQDTLELEEEKEITLNARTGIDYFMEDWMDYCNGQLDQMTLINVPKNKIDSSWGATDTTLIETQNIYELASQLALSEWSYSDDAVVAVADETFIKNSERYTGKVEGTLPTADVNKEYSFELEQTNSLNPVYNEFTVDDGYRYIEAEVWWDCLILAQGIMIPTGDPDVQLYCKQDDGWMQASAAAYWNVYMPPGREYTQCHVYKSGSWQVGVTDFPTESETEANRKYIGPFCVQGNLLKALLGKKVTYYVDITLYPGIDVEIPDLPPFGSKDVNFTLTWNNPNVDLGFSVIGPSGEAIHTMTVEEDGEEIEEGAKKVRFDRLGECLQGEHYSISVFALDDINTPIDFEIEYDWRQEITHEEADSLTSATEGAVLASTLNAPLLYVSATKISDETKDALYKLGVEKIYLVDLGKHANKKLIEEIGGIAKINKHYTLHDNIYEDIREITGTNDVIFTTIDPWTEWYMAELKPGNETEAALFIGPTAYIAAHHGSPVLIIDNHPELSSAVVWHNEFWSRIASDRYWNPPSVAEMVLTGKRIWSFLESHNYDKQGLETIITIADQYDIGVPWDRVFPGIANSGRFCGGPVDTSYWISRSMFYPAMIFANPALQGDVPLINGSLSERSALGVLSYPYLNALKITRKSGEEEFKYPVLFSPVTHKYRFNERASKYYECTYTTADGKTPGKTPTMESIDQGSINFHTNNDGTYFPDMSEIEVVPFYLSKGGYSTAYSTSLSAVVNNLNQGVIMWIHGSHGTEPNGGETLFWDPENGGFQGKTLGKIVKPFAGAVKDDNPAWGYEWLLGSTEEPDTMSMDIQGIIPFTNINAPIPAMGQDWVLARKPIREFLVERPILGPLFDIFINADNLYDGVIGTAGFSRYQYKKYTATEIEEAGLDNLHSAGFITSICQTSNTYFHLMLIRYGTVFQVQDPWPTSWYGAVWRQSIPRDIALGYTVGEAYARGISHVGTLYLGGGSNDKPQWWWDTAENVVYFGDPDLRVYVPETSYSDANHWEKEDTMPLRYDAEFSIDGHMPFGAVGYPKARKEMNWFEKNTFIIVILAIIIILLIALAVIGRKK
jgi:hypothetical protein